MSQKSHGKIRITKCQKTGFGILVEGLRGGTVSPTSNINFFHSQTEKDHLNIFLKKIEGSLRSLLWCPIKQTRSSTQIPPLPCSLGQIQATLGVNALLDRGRRYKVKSAGRQTSNKARSGLVFCRCGAAFVSSLREGSAGSWLVSSEG